jgi:DNA repair exonuclease SbcCD ATPase subunit
MFLNAKYIVSRKRMKAIKEQVIEYRSALKEIELYKILEKAYSNKGIKLMLLKDICQLLEDNMNAYSNLVYPEKTTFTISSDKDITVTYTTGTNINTEVSNLSRGEGNSFDLLLLISLIQLIPDDKRVNVCILDEVCANMDTPTRKYIHDNYFPVLRQIVPHVILLDTSDIPIEYADVITVEKKGNESTLTV